MSQSLFRSGLKAVWCPGCGDFAVLSALTGALEELALQPHQVGLLSGIGCSSRIAGYVDVYAFNLLHGRAIPTAEGVKLAKPELTVFAIGGDGDLFSIGGGHMAHAVRGNYDLTVICMNNFVYGLTKGQTSPTTPLGMVAPGTEADCPIDPVFSVLAYSVGTRASFVAQGISSDPKHLRGLIIQAVRHPGLSFINVLTCCPTYRKEPFLATKDRSRYIDESHDPGDLMAAMNLAQNPVTDAPHLGVFYRGDGRK